MEFQHKEAIHDLIAIELNQCDQLMTTDQIKMIRCNLKQMGFDLVGHGYIREFEVTFLSADKHGLLAEFVVVPHHGEGNPFPISYYVPVSKEPSIKWEVSAFDRAMKGV